MNPAHICAQAAQLQGRGCLVEAEQLYRKVMEATPTHLDAIRGLSSVLAELQLNSALLGHLQRSVMRYPDDVVLISQLALVIEEDGQKEKALSLHHIAILKEPRFLPAYVHAADIELDLGHLAAAAETAQAGILVDARYAPLHVILGRVARLEGQTERARAHWERAIRMDPSNMDALQFLAAMALEVDDMERAWAYAASMEALEPDSSLSQLIRGTVAITLQEYDTAEGHLQKAVVCDPNHGAAWLQLGCARFALERVDASIEAFTEASRVEPTMAMAWYNLGRALESSGRFAEAVPSFERALSLHSEGLNALAGLIQCKRSLCDWTELEAHEDRLISDLSRMLGTPAVNNVPLLLCAMLSDDREQQFQLARQVARAAKETATKHEPSAPAKPLSKTPERLKIGYLTYDCRDHPMAHLMVNVLETHCREGFEVWCYSVGPDDGSDYRRRMEAAPDHFVDANGWTDVRLDQKIRSDGIHLLIDLMGHTRGDRMRVLARKPAPIQVSWLGYPGTVGADYVDYLLVDPVVAPAEHADDYAEALAYLPTYQPNDGTLHVQGLARRIEEGLPEKGVVFGCFCRPDKLDPKMFAVWMRILQRVPASCLWLYVRDPAAQRNLLEVARAFGLGRERLVFASRKPKKEHLCRLTVADLLLDTRLYNGHTTTSDALLAGVPVITLLGNHFPSRVSASLLTAQGLDSCITHSLRDYEERVVELGSDMGKLMRLKESARNARETGNLFEMGRFLSHLEDLFHQMVDVQVKGGNPKSLTSNSST